MRPFSPALSSREGAGGLPRDEIRAGLEAARSHTLELVAGVPEADLDRVHSPLMSPLAWDLGHIAAFEDLWICRAAGAELLRPDLADVYDAFETPRAGRGDLPFLRASEVRDYMDAVRERTLAMLDRADEGVPLHATIWDLLIEHEQQHNETMCQTLQLASAGAYAPATAAPTADGMALVPAGEFTMGTDSASFAYDNERPQHDVDLPAFEIERSPVTVGDWADWINAGGYDIREHWSPEGWRWKTAEQATAPLFWESRTVAPACPVMHVSWFEADAYARAHEMRLPTEAEWEKAARAGVLEGTRQVWEWTSTEFDGYPGFCAYPYREYSEVFFNEGYRVLRGGSWATSAKVARLTFRNWDLPQRRQIFSGLRCARDA